MPTKTLSSYRTHEALALPPSNTDLSMARANSLHSPTQPCSMAHARSFPSSFRGNASYFAALLLVRDLELPYFLHHHALLNFSATLSASKSSRLSKQGSPAAIGGITFRVAFWRVALLGVIIRPTYGQQPRSQRGGEQGQLA
mmetsp:Transcript_72653/g.144329  ORF Transcript_72653/g.144329 Transcript_72653/m.144329 type:complete len:142 (-) Transcript_72653:388-813(-)